jgi:Fur family ferric uptake transcriptional regulator
MNNLFKKNKLSETPFRKEVLDIFMKHDSAIPLSTVINELKAYNRITLYRTIKIFIEKGIIHEITLSGEESSYALCKDECNFLEHQHQHVHFKCKTCGHIFCVEVEKFPKIDLKGYQIDQIEIQVTGICKNCNH